MKRPPNEMHFKFIDKYSYFFLDLKIIDPATVPESWPKEAGEAVYKMMIAQYHTDGFLKESFLVINGQKQPVFNLTWQGRNFIENGGYETLIAEQDKFNELQEKQITSVIDTNESVRKTNLIQKWSLIITGLAIVGTFLYQKWTYDVLKEEYNIHVRQEEVRKSEEVPERSRQESVKGTLEVIQRNLDSISLKMKPPK